MKNHWTLRYLFAKFSEKVYQTINPSHPWLTPQSISILDKYLSKDHFMVEMGSGRSTIWFSQKVGRLVSIEHHKEWYEKIKTTLESLQIKNTQILNKSIDAHLMGQADHYLSFINDLKENEIDVILIDGKIRDLCFFACLSKVKKNGLIIMDDANRYFISNSKSPYSKKDFSELDENWQKIHNLTEHWEQTWTSNHIHDTLILVKP
jgi:predicted O-methyltransferase YrrM